MNDINKIGLEMQLLSTQLLYKRISWENTIFIPLVGCIQSLIHPYLHNIGVSSYSAFVNYRKGLCQGHEKRGRVDRKAEQANRQWGQFIPA